MLLSLQPFSHLIECLQALKVLKTSSTYWEGNSQAESLQRVYGISFPAKKELDEWV